jgi:glutamine amidotransferase
MNEPLVVVDYRAGNLRSVETALKALGAAFTVSGDPKTVRAADRLIVPGVGEARSAMEELSDSGLEEAVLEHWRRGKPLLGICLGCQIIFEKSEERTTVCLAMLPGEVRRFRPRGRLKVPHMGWNQILLKRRHPVLAGIADGAYFYFLHSYYPVPRDAEAVVAECEYGHRFAAVVARDNLIACQFHPEKSGPSGLRMLENFLSWRP